jgi:hypothetical protein
MLTPAGWTYAPLTWPTNAGTPGNGRLTLSPWEIVTEVISLVNISFGLNSQAWFRVIMSCGLPRLCRWRSSNRLAASALEIDSH